MSGHKGARKGKAPLGFRVDDFVTHTRVLGYHMKSGILSFFEACIVEAGFQKTFTTRAAQQGDLYFRV